MMGHREVLIFFALLSLRSINSSLIQTFFQPDEYFQALEPAWQWTFGPQSGAWITWEWQERLRSSLHPLLYAAAYKTAVSLCEAFHADSETLSYVLRITPGLLSAVFAAIMDFSTWRLARSVYTGDPSISSAALILTICSPWQWFASTRSFSNSLEASLTATALALFPWDRVLQAKSKELGSHAPLQGLYPSLVIAAVAVVLRPTNIIIWATLSALLVWYFGDLSYAKNLLQSAMVCGSLVLAASVAVDYAFYGQWAFPPLRFFYLNVVQSLSDFYGKNRVDYYFTEGLPLMLTTGLPFAVLGFWIAVRSNVPDLHKDKPRSTGFQQQALKILAMTVSSTLLALTAISHKEVRFIFPLLPALHVLAAQPFSRHILHPLVSRASPLRHRMQAFILFFLILSADVFIAHYVTRVHQRGVIDVTHWLRWQHSSTESNTTSVAFLMPCHSTPWRSHLQSPTLDAWALTCEPPLNLITHAERAQYLDEADIFYLDPSKWLENNMQSEQQHAGAESAENRPWPQFLVFFEHLQPVMERYDRRPAYREATRFFNTHWIDDHRRQGDVVVWEKL